MTDLRRLGDIITLESVNFDDQNNFQRFNNLEIRILFPEDVFGINEFYEFSTPTKPVQFPSIETEIKEVGYFEASIIDRILDPQSSVFLIKGRMGVGKSTTFRFLMENFIQKIKCTDIQNTETDNKGLRIWIDCKSINSDQISSESEELNLINFISRQLWNRCSNYLDPKKEFDQFWNYLLEVNEKYNDNFVENVVAQILVSYPYLKKVSNLDEAEIKKRENVKDAIRDSNPIWYFRYLILIWRYLIQTRFLKQKGCAIIILDNVDSLSQNLQKFLIKVVIGTARVDGPTFLVAVRPETFERHGLNDIFQDVVNHQNPEPHQIVISRLKHFLSNPHRYFNAVPSLPSDEKALIVDYLSEITPKLEGSKVYKEFINAIAGRSIRNVLVLTQGLLGLSISDKKNREFKDDIIIRTIIRHRSRQFSSNINKWITNPFDVSGEFEGRYLTKIRILKYISSRGGSCHAPTLLSTFALFGFPNNVVPRALIELLRNECQLLISTNSENTFLSDEEEISITEVGLGYINHLIYNLAFIQEVMLDSRVPSNYDLPKDYKDPLCRDMVAMIKFLQEVHSSDVLEVKSFISQGIADYGRLFSPTLISLEIIQRIHDKGVKIIMTNKLQSPDVLDECDEVIELFNSLLYTARDNNNDLFGVVPLINNPNSE